MIGTGPRLRRVAALGLLGASCASTPPRHPSGHPLPQVVLWAFIPVFAEDEGPCVVLNPDGRVIARAGCVGPYVEFEPRADDLEQLLAALESPALPLLEPKYTLGFDTVENTLQWSRDGCRRQVEVDGWLGITASDPGNPGDRAQTPASFLAVHDALLALRARNGTRPLVPPRTVIRFLLVQGDAGTRRAELPVGWPAPTPVPGTTEAELALPGSDLQAAVEWVDARHQRGDLVELSGRFYWPARAFGDLEGTPRRLEVPPLPNANPREGLAPLHVGTCG